MLHKEGYPASNHHDDVCKRAEVCLRTYIRDTQAPSIDDVRKMAIRCEARCGELETEIETLRETQRQLERYRDRYIDLYDSAPLGYATLDEEGYLQEINLAGARMLAAPCEALIGYPFQEHVSAEDQQTFLEHVSGCIKGSEVTSEITLVARDGRRVAVQVHSVPLKAEEQHAIFCKMAIADITRLKQAEEQLRLLNKTLEQRVALRTMEAQRRASQLRALASQLTQAEQKKRHRLAQLLEERLQQLLIAAKIDLSGLEESLGDESLRKRAARVKQLLDESIAESCGLAMELSPPVLREVGLAAALQWLGRHMRQKHGLVVEVNAEPQAEPADEGVRIFLFQAVREMLANVVEHAGTGHAWVTMSRTRRNQVRIEVRDAGVGFDPARLEGRETIGGAFMLLSIRERLEVLGGRLKIDSAPQRGTTLTMIARIGRRPTRKPSTPVAGEVEAIAEEEHSPDRPSGIARVLLADDHPVIRRGLSELLARQPGIEVIAEAGDGEEAVALAFKFRPDVVIMDAIMPKLSGPEATRQIKSRLPATRIIALSMYDAGEMPAAMQDAGAALYVSKAADPEVLVAAVLHGRLP